MANIIMSAQMRRERACAHMHIFTTLYVVAHASERVHKTIGPVVAMMNFKFWTKLSASH